MSPRSAHGPNPTDREVRATLEGQHAFADLDHFGDPTEIPLGPQANAG